LEQLPDPFISDRPSEIPTIHEIPPGVMRNRLEPTAKAAFGVICEIAELAGELQQDLLRDVFSVGVLQASLSTPAVNVTTVVLNELIPRAIVQRVMSKPR
jgi:hypothetical protein